jgi:hypothetical protein
METLACLITPSHRLELHYLKLSLRSGHVGVLELSSRRKVDNPEQFNKLFQPKMDYRG